MRYLWPICLLLGLSIVLPATHAAAQWHDDTHPIAINPPAGWTQMGEPLRAEVNRTVRHVTPGPFRLGYQAYDNDVLLFPYLLVQYWPYSELPEDHRPTYRLDEHDTLQLIARLVKQFNAPDPLPEDMTLDAFMQAYDRGTVALLDMSEEGTFLLGGSIPLLGSEDRLEYRTLGRIGRLGVVFATVFTNEGLDTVERVIDETLATLVFDEGAGFASLPEREPEVVGFLPPPAEPLPSGAMVLGEDTFGVVPAQGYSALPEDAFDPHEPRLIGLLPDALANRAEAASGVTLARVLTQTPTSRRITRPWAAAGSAPLAVLGLHEPMERRPGVAAWARALQELVGIDPVVSMPQLEKLASDPEVGVSLLGDAGEGGARWRVEAVEMERGRVVMSRRLADAVDATLQTEVRLTLQAGRSRIAVVVSESYTDADQGDQAALAAMHDSVRFVGGERLVDLPPAETDGEDGGEPAPAGTGHDGANPARPEDPALPSDPDLDETGLGAPAVAPDNNPAGEPATGETPEEGPAPGAGVALPLLLGAFALMFVGVAAVVVVTSHAKAKRRREKARARRERRSELH